MADHWVIIWEIKRQKINMKFRHITNNEYNAGAVDQAEDETHDADQDEAGPSTSAKGMKKK